ncbi:hypothetical protein D9M69_452200 [compost metagenome]
MVDEHGEEAHRVSASQVVNVIQKEVQRRFVAGLNKGHGSIEGFTECVRANSTNRSMDSIDIGCQLNGCAEIGAEDGQALVEWGYREPGGLHP